MEMHITALHGTRHVRIGFLFELRQLIEKLVFLSLSVQLEYFSDRPGLQQQKQEVPLVPHRKTYLIGV